MKEIISFIVVVVVTFTGEIVSKSSGCCNDTPMREGEICCPLSAPMKSTNPQLKCCEEGHSKRSLYDPLKQVIPPITLYILILKGGGTNLKVGGGQCCERWGGQHSKNTTIWKRWGA